MRLPVGQNILRLTRPLPQYSGYSYGIVTHLIRKATALAVSFESPVARLIFLPQDKTSPLDHGGVARKNVDHLTHSRDGKRCSCMLHRGGASILST